MLKTYLTALLPSAEQLEPYQCPSVGEDSIQMRHRQGHVRLMCLLKALALTQTLVQIDPSLLKREPKTSSSSSFYTATVV